MAELTTLGFLEQPHTSAGRIPSPAGYRFYIDRLMQDYRLSVDETQSINQAMESRMQELDKAMSQVGKLVSKLTNLPAYTMTAPAGEVTVRHFEIILADAGSFILVVMTSDENVKNRLIKLPLHVTEQDIKLLSAVLNASLTGLPASGFTPEVMNRVTRSAGARSEPRARHRRFYDACARGGSSLGNLPYRAEPPAGPAGISGPDQGTGGARRTG